MATASTRSPFAGVSTRDLSINDHYDVYTQVKVISARWIPFAEALHLELGTISIIENDNPGNCKLCMRKALEQWLKKEYNYEMHGVPCWRLVCVAVKEGGGDPALAQNIAREHPLLSARVASRVAPQIYVPLYLPQERNHKLLKKLYDLQCSFSNTLYKTVICFEQMLQVSDIIVYISRHMVKLLGPRSGNRPGIEEVVQQEFRSRSIRNISDLFDILQYKYLSWFNYKLIIDLVNEFLSDDDTLKKAWLDYESELQNYFIENDVLSIKDARDVQFGGFNSPAAGTEIMIIKVDREDYTVDHLFFLHEALPKELNIPAYLYLSFIDIGSLVLEYWIPGYLCSLIFPISSEEQKERLASLGIAELSCGKYSYDLNKFTSDLVHKIKKKLYACFSELKARLDGLDAFINKMTSNKLARSKEFDVIMAEFQTLLQSSKNRMELHNRYDTFIEILKALENVNDDLIAHLQLSLKKTTTTRYHTRSKFQEEKDILLKSDFVSGKEIGGKVKTAEQNTSNLENEVDESLINVELKLTKKDMKDIILNEMVPCNFFLTTLLGLPYSGKSNLLLKFLNSTLRTISHGATTFKNDKSGSSVYSAALMRQRPVDDYFWFTLKEPGAIWCGSAIFHKAILCKYDIQMPQALNSTPDKFFDGTLLDVHLSHIYSTVKQVTELSDKKLQQMLSLGAIHMKILDIDDTNKGVKEFLTLISRHLNYNLGIICLSIDDIKELNDPTLMFQESKISCIMHQAVNICSQFSEVSINFIIICSKNDTKDHRAAAKETLLKAIKNKTTRLGLQPLQASILVLDPSSSGDMKKLNFALNQVVPKARRYIKLSWLFLHDALNNNMDDIVVSYDKLKDIAVKLGIKEMEFKEFLNNFTKFMSILYLPEIKSLENIVILRPVEFINTISSLFKTPDGKDFDGVYTMEQLNKIIPNKELADTVTKALCSVSLAIKTTSDKVNTRTSQLKDPTAPLLFVPLARSGQVLEKSFNNSLFIVFDSKLIQPDCQSFFISKLLILKGSSLLSGSDYNYHPNVFKILLVISRQEYIFSFIFRGTYIEVVMEESAGSSDVFEKIILCCKEALAGMSNFSYKLALKCLAPRPVFTTDDYIDPNKKGLEFLPKTKLCYHCQQKDSSLRKTWKEVIQKIREDEEKRREQVNVEELIRLAQNLGTVIKSTQSLKNLASQLRVAVEQEYIVALSKSCAPWHRILMILLMWERKKEATKETLKNALIRLGYPTVVLD